MNNTFQHPPTLIEAVRYFSDLDVCHEYMVTIKWPDGKSICPKCGGEHVGEIKSRRMFQCKAQGLPQAILDQSRNDFRGFGPRPGQMVCRGLVHRECQERHQQSRAGSCPGRHAKNRVAHAASHPAGNADQELPQATGESKATKASSAARPATCTKASERSNGQGVAGKIAVTALLQRQGSRVSGSRIFKGTFPEPIRQQRRSRHV